MAFWNPRRDLRHKSLPRRLLGRRIIITYGSAVLVTIAVSLGFPWIQLRLLTEQVARVRAEGAAALALQFLDPNNPDWRDANQRLQTRWPEYAARFPRESSLPVAAPLLMPLGEILGPKGFRADAKNLFLEKEQESFFSRMDEERQSLRLAMAIRRLEPTGTATLIGIIELYVPVPQVTRTLNAWVTVLGGALGAILAIVVFYLLTQRLVLNPLGKLRETAEMVASGRLQARARIKTGDEFELLATAFNEMLEHLIQTQEELSRINRSLDVRIEELARLNYALNEVSRLKSDFLANVSHELRTPLVSIIGFAELLQDALGHLVTDTPAPPGVDATRLHRFAANILTSGRMLLDLINDLLDLAKIEAGKLEPHYSTFALESVCRDTLDLVRPLADKKGIEIKIEIEPINPMRSDTGKIKQILYNLFSNAIKFSPQEGLVGLRVWPIELEGRPFAGLCVWDKGPGIPKDQLDTIFERFRQLDSSRTRQYQGTGLGLTITRQLVQMLGGRIAVESEVGEGARFTVWLPVNPGEGGAAKERDTTGAV